MFNNWFSGVDFKLLISTSLRIILIFVIAFIGWKIMKRVLWRVEDRLIHRKEKRTSLPSEQQKRFQTIFRLIRLGVLILICFVAGLIILSELGVQIGPILASAGILGLAVSFGAQNLVRDVISGFFMLLENQIRVGDVAIINGQGGLVEEVNFRTVVLRDLSGVVHIFPNGSINSLSNMTHEWSAYLFNIGVAYKENVDQVMELIKAVGDELKNDPTFGPWIIDDIEIFGVDEFSDSAVIIKARLKTRPIQQWQVGREYLRRIKNRFDEEGIEIPFPHRKVYFAETSKTTM